MPNLGNIHELTESIRVINIQKLEHQSNVACITVRGRGGGRRQNKNRMT